MATFGSPPRQRAGSSGHTPPASCWRTCQAPPNPQAVSGLSASVRWLRSTPAAGSRQRVHHSGDKPAAALLSGSANRLTAVPVPGCVHPPALRRTIPRTVLRGGPVVALARRLTRGEMHGARNFLPAKTFRLRPLSSSFAIAPLPLPRRTHREMETSPERETPG